MASFGTSQYGKFASFQNNSGSADAAAPLGGVYLFASGTFGNSKLYLQNEGQSALIDLDSLLDFAGDSGTGTVSNSQTLTIAGGTGLDTSASGQTITFSMDLNELTAAAVDASADSIAIIDATDDGSKKESIADLATAMAGDGLVASAGAFAVNVADMGTSMTGDLADTDEFAISDGGTMKKVDFSVVRDAAFADLSGDATVAAGGALTIAAGAVENSMLADDAVDSDELAAGAVDLAHMSVNSIDSDQYVDGSIDLAHMSANSVDSDQYVDGSIDTAHIANDQITNALMADDAIDSAQIADGAVDTAHLADNQVTLAKLAGLSRGTFIYGDASGDPAALAAGANGKILVADASGDPTWTTVSGDATLSAGALTISADSVENSMLSNIARGSVKVGGTADAPTDLDAKTSGQILVGDGTDIASVAVSGDATLAASGALTISAGAVENSMLADDAVDSDELAAGAVDLAHMSVNSIDSDQYVDGSIDLAHMSANSVDSDQYVDGSIDLAHMSANSVDSDQYVDGSIDLVHMSANSVDSDQYVDGSVDTIHLADDAVTAAKLASDAVVNASVASGAAIALNKIDGNVDMGGNFALGNQANDVCQITGPIKLAANSILDSGNNGAITFDGSGNTQAAGTLTVGTDGGGKQFTAHGASANEFMRYVPGDNLLKFQNASSATILTLGGDATSEYALDVTNGANNQNKVRASAFVTYSDESLKCEIQTMNNALDTVMSLNGVEFTWNDSGERDFGFIAQDVQNVLPKAVHVAADGVQGVDYSRLTSVLVEAVKAQQVQINDLKKALKN